MLVFCFTPIEGATAIDSLTPGHITVKDGEVEHSSANTAQPMALFYAVYELLSGVLNYLKSDGDKQYIFQSEYSDYGIKITRKRRSNALSVFASGHGSRLISQPTPEQLVAALWQGVGRLCSQYVPIPEQSEDDFTRSFDIRDEFNALLRQWTTTFPDLDPIVMP